MNVFFVYYFALMSLNYQISGSRRNRCFLTATKHYFPTDFPRSSFPHTDVHQQLNLINCQRCFNSEQTFRWGGQRAGCAPTPPLLLRSRLTDAANLLEIAVGSAIRWTGPVRPVVMSLTGGGRGLWTSPTDVEMS